MKKSLALILSLFIIFVFASCNNSKTILSETSQLSAFSLIGTESKDFASIHQYTVSSTENTVFDDSSEIRTDVSDSSTSTGNKVLVAYFSCTGNTENIAQIIADSIGADIYEIVPQIPYTDEDLDYGDSTTRATSEQHNPSARPEIADLLPPIDAYDTVFVGYPIWWGQAPGIIYTYLESYDFSGKTIIPFCTSHSSDIGDSDTNLHSLCSESVNWLAGKRFGSDASQSGVSEWIKSLNLNIFVF